MPFTGGKREAKDSSTWTAWRWVKKYLIFLFIEEVNDNSKYNQIFEKIDILLEEEEEEIDLKVEV